NDVYEGEGKLINSGKFTDLSSQEARYKISEYIEVNHQGNRKVNYHLRDWLISRQRYWGPPIPIIYCRKCWEVKSQKSKVKSEEGKDFAIIDGVNHAIVVVPEEDLPVLLPDVKDFQPKGTGQSPLAQIKEWVRVSCPDCGLPARRETDVSDTFLDSSWYYLRYPSVRSARSGQAPFDPDLTRKWLPVDMYIGGNEHAVLHLLYTRFVTMALADLGYLNFEEPFKKFRAHGLIIHQGAKMSKSRGNVINPNFYIEKYGSDTLRMYLLFIGPFDQGGDFSDQGIVGIWRFVNKIWRLVTEADSVTDSSQTKPRYRDNRNLKIMHQTIKKVTIDLEGLNFNTAIAEISREEIETFLILLAPLAPHLTEELWSKIGNKYSIHNQKWPRFNEEYLKEDKVIVVIQVDGKVRDKVEIEGKLDKEMITRLALDRERIKRYIKEKAKNYIYVEGKLLNIVTK
ncbi:class I tRNA ligase family protein, partial [Candidatus Curtissbacteria bacterium]|nr:class I tRNA ligase family protein [Candidatus Curtissbacteria bacterium]